MLFSVFQNFDFPGCHEGGGGVKGPKMAQNDKEFCVSLCISGTRTHMIVAFGTFV